jgi:hypothetical protein
MNALRVRTPPLIGQARKLRDPIVQRARLRGSDRIALVQPIELLPCDGGGDRVNPEFRTEPDVVILAIHTMEAEAVDDGTSTSLPAGKSIAKNADINALLPLQCALANGATAPQRGQLVIAD